MLSKLIINTILQTLINFSFISLVIYSLISPYMRVYVPTNNEYSLIDYSFTKVCINFNTCEDSESNTNRLVDKVTFSIQKAIYAFYIILIIFVGLVSLLQYLNIDVTIITILNILIIIIAIIALILLIIIVIISF